MTNPVVGIEDGQLMGTAGKDFLGGSYYSFLGIPFAKPPVGALRFKAPVPVEPWEGVRDATREGPECPSRHMLFMHRVGSEDNCLNLNVYTKNLPDESRRLKPVMVWIHGGGFVFGSNRKELYSPDFLITEDIVLVSINYRIGALGFLSLEDPSLDVPGNAGLKDMVLALKWVQRNIRHFCGDPNNVTIFGQSAGGASVQYLLLSPSTKGLFHKAIAQSGSCLNIWAKGCTNGAIIAEKLGFYDKDEKKILEYLSLAKVEDIIEAQGKILDTLEPCVVRPFGPVVEPQWSQSPFLTEDPLKIIKSGEFHQVPLMMGYTSNEGLFFDTVKYINLGPEPRTESNFEREIHYDLNLPLGSKESKELAAKIQRFYFGDKKPSPNTADNLSLLWTDSVFAHGIHTSVNLQKRVSGAPIYLYKMTLGTPRNQLKAVACSKYGHIYTALLFLAYKVGDGKIKQLLLRLAEVIPQNQKEGACHADDVGFLFRTFLATDLPLDKEHEVHVRRFITLWANFAKYGNPTPHDDDYFLNVNWKPVTKTENLLLNIGGELKMEVDPDGERMNFWTEILNNYKAE